MPQRRGVTHLSAIALQLLLITLAGRGVARLLRVQPPDGNGLLYYYLFSWAAWFTFGAAALSLLFVVIGFMRLDVFSMTIPAVALAAFGCIGFARPALEESAPITRTEKCVLVATALLACLYFLGALSPEVRHDPLFYHVQVPRLWLNFGRIVEVPENGHSYFPYGFEMLYAWSLSLGSDSSAKAMHWAAGVAAAIWCGWLAALVGARPAFAMGLFYTIPWIGYLSTTTYIDLATAMLGMGAVVMLWEFGWRFHHGGTEARTGVAFGALAGSAMATKYTAWPLLGIPLLAALALVVLLGWQKGTVSRWPGARWIVLAGFAASLALLPWAGRNYYHTGNPVAPLMVSVFGPESAQRTGLAGSFDSFAGQSRSMGGLLLAVPKYLLHILQQKYVLSVVGLLCGAVLLAMRHDAAGRQRTHLFVLLGVLVLFEALFTRGHPDGRYGLTSMGIGAVLVAGMCRCMAAKRAGSMELLAPVLFVGFLATSLLDWQRHQEQLRESWLPLLGNEAREEYLIAHGVMDRDFHAREQFFQESGAGRVLGANYPSRTRYWTWIQGLRNVIVDGAGPDPTAESIAASLRDNGFTHTMGEVNPGFDAELWSAFLNEQAVTSSEAGVLALGGHRD